MLSKISRLNLMRSFCQEVPRPASQCSKRIMLWLTILCGFVITRAQFAVPETSVEAFSPPGHSRGRGQGNKNGRGPGQNPGLALGHNKNQGHSQGQGVGQGQGQGGGPNQWQGQGPNQNQGQGQGQGNKPNHGQSQGQINTNNRLGVQEDSSSTTTTTTTTLATTLGSCEFTETEVNGREACKGRLIFQDEFLTRIENTYWTIEEKFAGAPDYEFVIYVNRPEILQISKQILKIKPELIENVYGEGIVTATFDLGENCTGVAGSPECRVKPDAGFILPPVLSSQITTKNKFSFKYGKIEVRAKLPKGDWIYPELYLNSANEDYGIGYDSGQIRIAFAPGNEGQNNGLHGGIILGSSTAARSYGKKSSEKRSGWANEFHRYAVIWKPDSIVLSVDDKVYGTIYPPNEGFSSLSAELQIPNADRWNAGRKLAPFDKEMYITLGVGVGGFNFEDRSDGTKPWKNGGRSSMKTFYAAQPKWSSTWNDNSTLQVDYVKIWAL